MFDRIVLTPVREDDDPNLETAYAVERSREAFITLMGRPPDQMELVFIVIDLEQMK